MTHGDASESRDRSARGTRSGPQGPPPTTDPDGWLRELRADGEPTGWPEGDLRPPWPPAPAPGRDVGQGWPERRPGKGRTDGRTDRRTDGRSNGHNPGNGHGGAAALGLGKGRGPAVARLPSGAGRRRTAEPSGGSRRNYLLAGTLVVLLAAGLAGAVVRNGWLDGHRGQPAAPQITAPAGPVAGTPGTTPTPSPSTRAVVDRGAGTFVAADTIGPVLGTAGILRQFKVEVENGIGESPDGFAAAVDKILGDPRSWIASGQFRLQRVPRAAPAEFTIFLASPVTSEAMCRVGGLQTDRFTSCRLTGQVIINDARWLTAIPEYNAPLDVYRGYAINHEVGHQLGHGHEACTGPDRPAPVMQQQTLGLKGCVANAWPFLNGVRHAGPQVP
jgi:hypothetical protein